MSAKGFLDRLASEAGTGWRIARIAIVLGPVIVVTTILVHTISQSDGAELILPH